MQRLYPRTKFADITTLDEQFEHIRSEYCEAVMADGMGHRDEELADLEHSIQGDEDPWQDIAGYGLLGMGNSEIRKDCSDCMFYYDNEDHKKLA